MFKKMMKTGSSTVGLWMRLSLGGVMLIHGLQQTLGWFNGTNFGQKVDYYMSLGVPKFFAACGVLTVTVGAILLIIGLWGRIMAFLTGAFIFTAMMLIHIHNGFFMNWEGQKTGEGFEYHLLALGLAIGIIVYGSGALSLDRYLSQKNKKETPTH